MAFLWGVSQLTFQSAFDGKIPRTSDASLILRNAENKQTGEAGDVSTSHEELRGVRKCLPLTFPSGRRRAIHAEASTINKESPETEASAFFCFFSTVANERNHIIQANWTR